MPATGGSTGGSAPTTPGGGSAPATPGAYFVVDNEEEEDDDEYSYSCYGEDDDDDDDEQDDELTSTGTSEYTNSREISASGTTGGWGGTAPRLLVAQFADNAGSASSAASSAQSTPRLVRMNVTMPLYVYVTRLLTQQRGVRIYTAACVTRLSIKAEQVRAGRVTPDVHYRIVPETRFRANAAAAASKNLRILSIRVYEQNAEHFPIDFSLYVLGAPRPYIVRHSLAVRDLDEELLPHGITYTNDVCNLAFCSLDALGFDESHLLGETRQDSAADTLSGRVAPLMAGARHEPILVPKSYVYASLLREVALATELERMDPLSRRCATRSSLLHGPLESSEAWLYENPRSLFDAIDFVRNRLVPATRHQFAWQANSTPPPHFDAHAFDRRSWPLALSPFSGGSAPRTPGSTASGRASVPSEFSATIKYMVYFADIPPMTA